METWAHGTDVADALRRVAENRRSAWSTSPSWASSRDAGRTSVRGETCRRVRSASSCASPEGDDVELGTRRRR